MPTYKGEIGDISVKSDHEIEWTIDNFCSYEVKDEFYSSPYFSMWDRSLYLEVWPNVQTSENDGWISLYLKGYDEPTLNACFAFGVKKVNGTVEHIHGDCSWVFQKGRNRCGYPKFLLRSELLQRKADVLASESLTLTCSLWMDGDVGRLDSLSRNFADLFTSKRGCDATVKVKGEEFSVHRTILSARSPVLAAMFEVDMKEKKTGLVSIEDFDPEAFREFLTYLYSGKVEKNSSNIFELYKMADKYDVPDLKSYCVFLLMTNMSFENVLDAAILGSQFDEMALMTKTQIFFNKHFEAIILTNKWDDTFLSENATVANKLLKAMAKERKE